MDDGRAMGASTSQATWSQSIEGPPPRAVDHWPGAHQLVRPRAGMQRDRGLNDAPRRVSAGRSTIKADNRITSKKARHGAGLVTIRLTPFVAAPASRAASCRPRAAVRNRSRVSRPGPLRLALSGRGRRPLSASPSATHLSTGASCGAGEYAGGPRAAPQNRSRVSRPAPWRPATATGGRTSRGGRGSPTKSVSGISPRALASSNRNRRSVTNRLRRSATRCQALQGAPDGVMPPIFAKNAAASRAVQ